MTRVDPGHLRNVVRLKCRPGVTKKDPIRGLAKSRTALEVFIGVGWNPPPISWVGVNDGMVQMASADALSRDRPAA
jgi:hypothetical protein